MTVDVGNGIIKYGHRCRGYYLLHTSLMKEVIKMRKKKYKDLTMEEQTVYNYKIIVRRSKWVAFLCCLNMLMIILAYLDKIIFFVYFAISYLH